MAFHYEVIIDPPMGELFRQKFITSIGRTKCCQMFKLISPGMPNLWEFKSGKDIFTLSFSEESGEQKERISIDSMTLDLKDVVVDTIKSGLKDYLVNFISPLAEMPLAEFEKRVNAYLEKLAPELISKSATG
jgi:hypothetical protein